MDRLRLLFEHWEPLWLAGILFFEGMIGIATFIVLIMEYKYDAAKDARKKTKTVKRTVQSKGGNKVTEVTTEISEPVLEEKKDE